MTVQTQGKPHYVLLRVRGSQRPHRLQLPVAIGSSGLCDVVVNAGTLEPLAYLIERAGRGFVVRSPALGREVPAQTLRQIGVEVLAVLEGVAEGSSLPKRLVGEALAREGLMMQRLPKAARTVMLGSLPQRVRLGAWGLVAAVGLSLAFVAPSEGPPDRSQTPLPLQWDTIRKQTVGASPGNPKFERGFEKGIRFAFEAPPEAEGKAAILSFTAAGLNVGREVVLTVNGNEIFASAAEAACAAAVCEKLVRIPGGVVQAGANVLQVTHNEPASSYFLADLHLRSVPAATATEAEQAALWLSLAQRAFDDRNIVPENLLTVDRHLNAVIALATAREGLVDLESKARALRGEARKELEATTSRLWGDVAIAERLEKIEAAEKSLQQLAQLYPDPNSQGSVRVRLKLQQLKEQRQR